MIIVAGAEPLRDMEAEFNLLYGFGGEPKITSPYMKQLNSTQKEILKSLERLWKKYPDQRFGQLLFNYSLIGTRAELGRVDDPFHYEDEEMLNSILNNLK